jgi:hypothetical protein
MYLLLCISCGFGAISLSLWVLAILWPERKADEAYNLFMQVRPPAELIGMRGRCVAVHWYTAHRYYTYKWSVYVRMWNELTHLALGLGLSALLCAIIAGIIKLFNL